MDQNLGKFYEKAIEKITNTTIDDIKKQIEEEKRIDEELSHEYDDDPEVFNDIEEEVTKSNARKVLYSMLGLFMPRQVYYNPDRHLREIYAQDALVYQEDPLKSLNADIYRAENGLLQTSLEKAFGKDFIANISNDHQKKDLFMNILSQSNQPELKNRIDFSKFNENDSIVKINIIFEAQKNGYDVEIYDGLNDIQSKIILAAQLNGLSQYEIEKILGTELRKDLDNNLSKLNKTIKQDVAYNESTQRLDTNYVPLDNLLNKYNKECNNVKSDNVNKDENIR